MRRSVWVLLAILAALLALIFFLDNGKDEFVSPERESPLKPIFLFEEEEDAHVIALKIESEEATVSLIRGMDGLWDAIEPEGVEVAQGMVEAAASQVLALPLLAEGLSVSPVDVGIGKQAPLVEVGFANGAVSVFRSGDLTPSGSGYYIQYKEEKIGIVGKDALDSLFRLLLLFE